MPLFRGTCLEALEEATDELGYAPTDVEYKALDVSPPHTTIGTRFGSWTTALYHLNVDHRPRRKQSAVGLPD